jgi:hypothetical protein
MDWPGARFAASAELCGLAGAEPFPGAFAKAATSCSIDCSICAESPAFDAGVVAPCACPGDWEIRKTPTEKPFGRFTSIPSTAANANGLVAEVADESVGVKLLLAWDDVVAGDRHWALFENPVAPPTLILIRFSTHCSMRGQAKSMPSRRRARESDFWPE